MKEDLVEKMALDLGISRFESESDYSFRCRTIYSGLSCWIKTTTLDKPVWRSNEETAGVSRRHIYDKCNRVMESFIEIYPDVKEWLDDEENENAITTIRTRLLRHGDIVNEGFDTNVLLSYPVKKTATSSLSVCYGETIGEGIIYSGISTIRLEKTNIEDTPISNSKEWLSEFVNDAWWEKGIQKVSGLEFFNACRKAKNNYSLWEDKPCNDTYSVIFSRKRINKGGYEYYILRPLEDLYHRIDPFLVEMGEHIRVMNALRSIANNPLEATVNTFEGYVKINLNGILPGKERMLLESYAWPVKSVNDLLEWVLISEVWKYIKPYLDALGIKFTEVSHG